MRIFCNISLAAVAILLLSACQIKHSDQQKAADKEQKKISAPTLADVELGDLQRNNVSLKSEIRKNQITIIDFWASWCGPCRAEMPLMVNIYNQHKDNGLGIIGVSLDSDYSSWEKAITDNKLTWTQLSDLRGWDSYAAKTYNVTAIPYTIIVDRNAKIIASGLRGEQLEKYINNYFSTPHTK